MFNNLSYYELANQYRSPAALAQLTVNELRVIARGRIVGRSKLRTKAMLVEAISKLLEDSWARIASEEEARKAQELEELALEQLRKESVRKHINETDYLAKERKLTQQDEKEGVGSNITLTRLEECFEMVKTTLEIYHDDMETAKKIAKAQGATTSMLHLKHGNFVVIDFYTDLRKMARKVSQDEKAKDLSVLLWAFCSGYRDLAVNLKKIYNSEYSLNVYDVNSELVGINKDVWIKGAVKVLENCEKIKTKKEGLKILFALGVLTGRRPYAELLHQAHLEKIEGDDKHMHFTGQAKGRAINKREILYRIPVLAHPDLILKGFNRLKELGMVKPDYHPTQIKSRNSGTASEMMPYILQDYERLPAKKFPLYSSRGIYAAIITAMYKPQNMTDDVFLSKSLGHDKKSAETAKTYCKFYCLS